MQKQKKERRKIGEDEVGRKRKNRGRRKRKKKNGE